MNKISNGAGAQLFHRLATGYHAGLDLRSLWQRESKSISPGLSRCAKTVLARMAEGDSLSEAMSHTGGYFTPLTIAVVRAGESSGRLEQSFRRLADHFSTWRRFRRDILVSMAWPMFELGMAILIIGALILLMGWAASRANQDGIDWFGWGWGTADYFRLYVATICFLACVIGGLYLATRQGWLGALPGQFARFVPIVGTIVHNLSLARLSWALGAALGAGMNAAESVRIGISASQDRRLMEVEPRISRLIEENESIYESLAQTARLPDEFLTFVSNGELAGELPESLDRLAVLYQERVESAFNLLKVVTFFVTLIIVGMLIIGAVFFLYFRLVLEPLRELSV
jgi:type II secretory pathway component PulF